MTATIPSDVQKVLDKLDESDQGILKTYFEKLQKGIEIDEEEEESKMDLDDELPFPPDYEKGEDYDLAADMKMQAADLKAGKDYEGALEKYNAAIIAAPPSALLYANRAFVLHELKRPHAALEDCNKALEKNPDSAKALRIRGRIHMELGKNREALKDLSASQQIDYDDTAARDLKIVSEKVHDEDAAAVKKRNIEEEKIRKRAEEIKKAREEAKKKEEEEKSSSIPPTGGMPGGMPGMPPGMDGLMGMLMSDPELAEGMKNPKVQKAFQDLMASPGGAMGLMSNPAKLQEMMADPEVGPFLQKVMAKMAPMAGGAGMPGGARMPGGRPNAARANPADMEDIPNLD